MKECRTINSEWVGLVKAIFGEGPIGQNQYAEMQKAFYAGAFTVINIMISVSDNSLSDEAGAEIFDSLRKECIEFARGAEKVNDDCKEKIKIEIIEMCIAISDHCFKDDYDESELIEVHKHLKEIV